MAGFWDIPRVWQGETVYVIGGGHSLRNFDWNLLAGKRCIATNNGYALGGELCPFAIFGDYGWFKRNRQNAIDFSGVLLTAWNSEDKYPYWIRRCRRLNTGWSTKQNTLAWNGNTGAMAVNFASLLGAARIVLLGFDMTISRDGETNWYDNKGRRATKDIYERFVEQFSPVKTGLKQAGIDVVNANPMSRLPFFPKMDREKACVL